MTLEDYLPPAAVRRRPVAARLRRLLACLADGRDEIDVTPDSDSLDRIYLVALCRGFISGGGEITLAGLATIGRVPASSSRELH